MDLDVLFKEKGVMQKSIDSVAADFGAVRARIANACQHQSVCTAKPASG